MKRCLRLLTLLSAVLAACAPVDEKPGAPDVKDLSSLPMQVKTALINADPLAAAAVQVQQRDGQIALTGFVDSEAKKKQLEKVARQAAGSLPVVNELQIK